MKFQIVSNTFKDAATRVQTIIPTRTSYPAMQTIKVIATANGELVLQTFDGEDYLSITIGGSLVIVRETGTVYLDQDILKKICKMTDFLTVETKGDKICVYTQKKRSELKTANYVKDMWHEFPVLNDEYKHVLTIPRDEFVDIIDALDTSRAKDEGSRPAQVGFGVDTKNEWIAASDGKRITVKYMNGRFITSDDNFVMSGSTNKLKKISEKGDNNVEVWYSTEHTVLKGRDFTYFMRTINGTFLNIERLMQGCKRECRKNFMVDPNEVLSIVSGYAKEKAPKTMRDNGYPVLPMYITKNKEKICLALESPDFTDMDILDTAENYGNIKDEYLWCGNPQYVKDGFSLFTKEDKVIVYTDGENGSKDGQSSIKEIVIDNNDYFSFILPINPPHPDKIKNKIRELMAS